MKIHPTNSYLKRPAFTASLEIEDVLNEGEERPKFPEIGKVYQGTREVYENLEMQAYLTQQEKDHFIKQAAAIGKPSDKIRVKVHNLGGNYCDYNVDYSAFYHIDFITYINGKLDNFRLTTAEAKVKSLYDSAHLYDHKLISIDPFDSIHLTGAHEFASKAGDFILPQLLEKGLEIIKERVARGKY